MRKNGLIAGSVVCALSVILIACRKASPAPTLVTIPALAASPAPTQIAAIPTPTRTPSPPTPTPLPTWPDRWIPTGGPDGGLIRAVAVNPSDPNILYAAGTGGAVFRSDDGGETWSPGKRLARASCTFSSLVIDIQASDTIFAASSCAGVYKSRDAGRTWVRADAGIGGEVDLLIQSPHAPGLLLAAGRGGHTYRSRDAAASWEPISDGLPDETIGALAASGPETYWATTANGHDGTLYRFRDGVWSAVPLGQPPETETTNVLVDPTDPTVLYVGLARVQDPALDPDVVHILRSIDGGFNWSPLSLPALPEETEEQGVAAWVHLLAKEQPSGVLYVASGGRIWMWSDSEETWQRIELPAGLRGTDDLRRIAVDPTNSNVLYLPLGSGGIIKSEDNGQTWHTINHGLNNTAISVVAADPVDPARLYVASVGDGRVFQSTDYGDNWSTSDDITSIPSLAHGTDDLTVDPNRPDRLYQVVDGGRVFRSDDGGSTWALMWPEFRLSSIYGLAVAPSDPRIVYANRSGFGLFRSDDGGKAWRFRSSSVVDHTNALAVHPDNPDFILSGDQRGPFETSAQLQRSTDGGETWEVVLELPDALAFTSVAFDPRVEPYFAPGKQPADPTRLYAASVGPKGRLWFSNDGGQAWQPLNDELNFTSVRALAIAPHRPGVAYASVWGGGTWRTEDGGQNWHRLPGDPAASAVAVAVDPNNRNVIYIADGTTPHLYRSTDGGNYWELLFDAGTGYDRLAALALAPSDPKILYISAADNTAGAATGAVFQIDANAPAGENAEDITSDLPAAPTSLAVHRRDPRRIFALVADGGVWKTVDDGASWRQVKGDLPQVDFTRIAVDPIMPDTLFLAGSSHLSAEAQGLDPNEVYGIWKSTDDGNTWVKVGGATFGRVSGPVKTVAFHPDDQRVMYAAGHGGIYLSPDRGETWTSINGRLPFVPANAVATDGQTLYAGSGGAGVFSGALHPLIHTADWTAESQLALPVAHVQITLHPTDAETLYGSAYPGGVFKTTDGGATWSARNAGLPSFAVAEPARQGYYALALAPSAPEVLYVGLYAEGVYRSDDGGASWRPVNGDTGELGGAGVQALLVQPDDPDIVYVATERAVWRTADGGQGWTDFSTGLAPAGDVRTLALGNGGQLYAGTRGYGLYVRNIFQQAQEGAWRQLPSVEHVQGEADAGLAPENPLFPRNTGIRHTSLLIHPGDSNTLFARSFPAGVYKSTDGGAAWREQNVGLGNEDVLFLAFHPSDAQTIYAGTTDGIAHSLDGGATWHPWDVGWPPGQWVLNIAFDPTNATVVYACSRDGQNQEGGGTVMKSTDGGATWLQITLGLDVGQAFYQVLVDRFDPNILYLLTERDGIYISRNGGETWTSWNQGLWDRVPGNSAHGNTERLALSADGRLLYFGSAGSSVWRRPAAGAR